VGRILSGSPSQRWARVEINDETRATILLAFHGLSTSIKILTKEYTGWVTVPNNYGTTPRRGLYQKYRPVGLRRQLG
jgi:hypothetical protein